MNAKNDNTKKLQCDNWTTTYIDLLRHGECEGGNIFRGSTNVALTEHGEKRMQNACRYLLDNSFASDNRVSQTLHATEKPTWDTVITSPLQRCHNFCTHFFSGHESHASIPIVVNKHLRELHFGDWEAKNSDELWQTQGEKLLAWKSDPFQFTPPNAEPMTEFMTRIQTWYESVLNDYAGQRILVVTHGGVIRALLAKLLHMPFNKINSFEVPYGCVSRLCITQCDGQRFETLLSHNLYTQN